MVSFRMFAGTDVGLRENNEDNFTVCPDMTRNEWIVPADYQQAIQLGKRGCVMVVADGMGGQNAGEVASAIAIDTVQELMSPACLSADVLEKPGAVKSFLKKVIAECDIRVKKRAEEDSSAFGMGSTVVISWLLGSKLYVAWLGDSRAYSFVPQKGIVRLSKDHSYVQQLVDAGAITEDEAMAHPDSNVITRSLGDMSQKAMADVAEYDVEDGQVILLCSDGLCGVCRDDKIGGIIEKECNDLQKCRESLTSAALAAGGSDNITISLLHVSCRADGSATSEPARKKKNVCLAVALFSAVAGFLLFSLLLYAGYGSCDSQAEPPKDSIRIVVGKNSLYMCDTTHYHVFLTNAALKGGLLYDYDSTLLRVNAKDSVISRVQITPPIKVDTITCIRIRCAQDTSISSSVSIMLKKVTGSFGVHENVGERRQDEENSEYIKPKNSGDLTVSTAESLDSLTIIQKDKKRTLIKM